MPIKRVLERDGKQLTFTAANRAEAVVMVKETRAKLRQGWVPTTPAKAVLALEKALDKLGLWQMEWITGLTDAEVEVAYANQIKRKELVSEYTLARRPTRALFAYMIKGHQGLHLKGAMKVLAKNPEHKKWMIEGLGAALAQKNGFDNEDARAFAQRWIKLLGAAAPVAPKHETGTTEAKLLAAIADAPEANQPREVYADWLIDQGNPFGEYIHAAIAAHPDREAFTTTEKTKLADKLEKKHAKAWLAPIKPFARSTILRGGRGLIRAVATEGEGFVKAAAAISARAPRADLVLTGVKKKHIAAIAAAPLGAFARVVLAQQRLDDADVVAIVSSPTFAGVQELDISEAHFGDAGILAIAASPHLAALRVLDASRRYAHGPAIATAATLAALLSSNRLPALRELKIFAAAVSGVFAKSTLQLQALEISTQDFTNADMAELVGAKALANLEHLSITCAHTGKLEVDKKTVLAAKAKLKKLQSLHVEGVVTLD